MKRAMVIQKNNELCQEFYFCHPTSKLKVNQIYNFSYTGCQLWDLFYQEAVHLENSYNVSVRIMLGLPQNTHRYLVQPLAADNIVFAKVDDENLYKIKFIKEIIDVKHGNLEVDGLVSPKMNLKKC